MPSPKTDLPTLLLPSAASWSAWLTTNSTTSHGVWLIMSKRPKKSKPSDPTNPSHPTTLTLPQALDEALCHGWINGQAQARDEATVMQRFTPRAKRSTWSQVNVGHVERLAEEGRMREGGWAEVERARGDGRWDAAYGAFSTIQPPEELVVAIDEVPAAREAWERLSKTERYMIILKLANVRTPKGRERNIARAVERLASGQPSGSQASNAKVRAKSKKAAVTESDSRPSPLPIRESRAERAERRAKRRGKGERRGSS